jgi:hypothetical protein
MKKKLSGFTCLLLLIASCHEKDSIFKLYEFCTILKTSVVCTDFRLPEKVPEGCKFLDKKTGNYTCSMSHIFGYNAASSKSVTDLRIKALRLEKDFRKAGRDLLLCRGL